MPWPITSARRRPYSRSAAGLKFTIFRAASATTTASGAAPISASVTARRSAISLVSSTRRIRAAMIVASARAVDCHSAGHPDRSATRMRAHGQGSPGSRAMPISTPSWRPAAPGPGRVTRPWKHPPAETTSAWPSSSAAICTIRAGSTAACGWAAMTAGSPGASSRSARATRPPNPARQRRSSSGRPWSGATPSWLTAWLTANSSRSNGEAWPPDATAAREVARDTPICERSPP